MSELTLVAEFASRCTLVIFDMREDANNHTTDPSRFLLRHLCTLSGLSIQKDFVPWRQNLPKVFFRQSVSAPVDQETIVLVVHDDFRG